MHNNNFYRHDLCLGCLRTEKSNLVSLLRLSLFGLLLYLNVLYLSLEYGQNTDRMRDTVMMVPTAHNRQVPTCSTVPYNWYLCQKGASSVRWMALHKSPCGPANCYREPEDHRQQDLLQDCRHLPDSHMQGTGSLRIYNFKKKIKIKIFIDLTI